MGIRRCENENVKMKHGSIFSGVGGFDLAASYLNWENVFQIEIDSFCQEVLRRRFPSSVRYCDIRRVNAKKYYGAIDVISGGWPCQPFSAAGKRRGSSDNRYLWPQMLRIINEVRPTWVVGENVVGITSMVQSSLSTSLADQASLWEEDKTYTVEEEFIIETICKDFERMGYSVQPIIIPACAVGAWHRRDRIWFLAYSDRFRYERRLFGTCRTEEILPAPFLTRIKTFNLQRIEKDILAKPGLIENYDGFSTRLVKNEIKGYGNSIVPAIAYEIFRAIDIIHHA
ncbi:DNA cytosine methyltransferase [Chitinophaga sp. LS1]|uniref:DNA cytosine methyltransferase n=1 Tax=Chitinophaga sp. LS1 TaxID=3051176 RepID=UPI002AAA6CD9|nr:DNA cytosine methyltransferase [Chitinophaga sp. LS1]WPV67556.1 DNA cytosine methyltransferase [Chitinophaga sp. LS1]